MSTLINNMPKAENLQDTHIMIVEQQENGSSIETQKTTLLDLYKWLSETSGHTYSIKTDEIEVNGVNLSKTINNSDNTITLNFLVPEWSEGTYAQGSIVRYENSLYVSLSNNNANITDTEYWEKIGYKIGRHLTLTDDNILSGMGIDIWSANTEYQINDFVIYNKRLYQCIVANTDAQWNKEHWLNIGEGNGILVYENEKSYEAGSIVIYENRLYKRLTSGADITWTSRNWLCISNGDYSKVYIKYAHDIPTKNSDMLDVPAEYIGIYTGSSEVAPTAYTQYVWYKIRGEDGYVNVDANTVVIILEVPVDGWSNSTPYTQTVLNNNLTATMYPIVDISYSEDSDNWTKELAGYGCITRVVIENGAATFYCAEDKPKDNFSVKLRINGDVNADSFVTKQEFNEFKQMIGEVNELLEETLGGY